MNPHPTQLTDEERQRIEKFMTYGGEPFSWPLVHEVRPAIARLLALVEEHDELQRLADAMNTESCDLGDKLEASQSLVKRLQEELAEMGTRLQNVRDWSLGALTTDIVSGDIREAFQQIHDEALMPKGISNE